MRLTVYWTRFAEHKLDDIYEYFLYKAGSKVAESIVSELIERTLYLEDHPNMGPKEDLLKHRPQDFRYLIQGNYKIIYRINHEQKRIEIFNVFDTRQDPGKLDRT